MYLRPRSLQRCLSTHRWCSRRQTPSPAPPTVARSPRPGGSGPRCVMGRNAAVPLTRIPGNAVLDHLEEATLTELRPRLHACQLSRGTVLFEAGHELGSVWFPTSGVVSLSSTTTEGGSVEVAAIGSEGLIGGSIGLGLGIALCRGIVQVEGEALWVNPSTFAHVARAHPDLHAAVVTFLGTLLQQLIRSTACNRFHTGEQRLSRWLLETADRAGASAFPLTQEVLAHMLGMRRPWVTKVIRRLSERGCIRYRRGELAIISRRRLEESSCDCYLNIRQQRTPEPPLDEG
jgi:CRP-like cAMP-binding protein